MRGGAGAPTAPARRNSLRPVVLLVGLLLGVEVVVFAASTVPGVRPVPGFSTWIDGWLQGAGYVTAAALALLGFGRATAHRALWACLAAALSARALGFVLWLGYVRFHAEPAYPSVADAAWLAMYGFVLAGLALLARRHGRRLTTSLVLDGAVGGLAAAAVAVSLLYPTIVAIAAPGTPVAVVAVNLAYPVLDLMLLVVVIGVLLVLDWRPPPAVWVIAVGIAGFAVVDSVFVYQAVAGTFRPGTPLSSVSLALMALLAAACWLPTRRHDEGPRDPLPSVVLPGVFAFVCLLLLLLASERPVPVLGVVFAGAGLAIAIVRTALTFQAVRAVAQHRHEARTDDLTGLANRRAFNERLAGALARRTAGERSALLVVDLDDFKAVNDALGHHYGDELLRQAAPRLQQAVPAGDVVARIGGDEFAVLLAGADARGAASVAERVRAGFRRPFRLGGRELVIAPSVGIALVPDDGREPVELLQHADLAMYEAKATRSGHAFFPRGLQPMGRVRLETTEQLRRAIEDDELVLHYQPQVSLPTGRVTGVEALVRWQSPQAGLLMPDRFLHQAESGGLMPLLTSVVLRQALAQAATWRARGIELTTAVNVSVSNLLDPCFPDQVAGLLAAGGLPAGALELELTEDLFMADPARASGAISALLDAGVTLVIDDYGTGYSSLGYLRDLHEIRGLKLDRSFVARMDAEPRSAAIVESTIALAHSLGMHVVAEGVETTAVRRRLAGLGCEFAQGYLFGRPAPADVVELGDRALRPGTVPGPRSGRLR